jgi:hypothetical protein
MAIFQKLRAMGLTLDQCCDVEDLYNSIKSQKDSNQSGFDISTIDIYSELRTIGLTSDYCSAVEDLIKSII